MACLHLKSTRERKTTGKRKGKEKDEKEKRKKVFSCSISCSKNPIQDFFSLSSPK